MDKEFPSSPSHSFPKAEHLCRRKVIEALFAGGQESLSAYPLRAVFMPSDESSGTQVLISVSKRHFKHAVQRNRVKRQVREAFRKNKALLAPEKGVYIAFLWLSKEFFPSQVVEEKMQNLLSRIQEHV